MDNGYVGTLEAIIRTLVVANDTIDGAVGEVRAALGDEAARITYEVLVETPRAFSRPPR